MYIKLYVVIQEFETIYKINVSQISSLKVDKLSDMAERILKKSKRGMTGASIVDEYIAMVDISRNAAVTMNDVRLPTEGKRTLTLNASHLKQTSETATPLLNIPEWKETHAENEVRFTSVSKSQSNYKPYVPLRNNSVDMEDDYAYQLMQNDDDNSNTNHAQSGEK